MKDIIKTLFFKIEKSIIDFINRIQKSPKFGRDLKGHFLYLTDFAGLA